jgi:anthranilate/para-aminobenzoate synthase component I
MQTQKPTLELLACDAAYRENPTSLFHQVCGARPATLLLESADIDSKDDLKSLLLVDSALRITALGDTVTIQALSANGASLLPCWMPPCPLALRMNNSRMVVICDSLPSARCWMKTPVYVLFPYLMPSVYCRGW